MALRAIKFNRGFGLAQVWEVLVSKRLTNRYLNDAALWYQVNVEMLRRNQRIAVRNAQGGVQLNLEDMPLRPQPAMYWVALNPPEDDGQDIFDVDTAMTAVLVAERVRAAKQVRSEECPLTNELLRDITLNPGIVKNYAPRTIPPSIPGIKVTARSPTVEPRADETAKGKEPIRDDDSQYSHAEREELVQYKRAADEMKRDPILTQTFATPQEYATFKRKFKRDKFIEEIKAQVEGQGQSEIADAVIIARIKRAAAAGMFRTRLEEDESRPLMDQVNEWLEEEVFPPTGVPPRALRTEWIKKTVREGTAGPRADPKPDWGSRHDSQPVRRSAYLKEWSEEFGAANLPVPLDIAPTHGIVYHKWNVQSMSAYERFLERAETQLFARDIIFLTYRNFIHDLAFDGRAKETAAAITKCLDWIARTYPAVGQLDMGELPDFTAAQLEWFKTTDRPGWMAKCMPEPEDEEETTVSGTTPGDSDQEMGEASAVDTAGDGQPTNVAAEQQPSSEEQEENGGAAAEGEGGSEGGWVF